MRLRLLQDGPKSVSIEIFSSKRHLHGGWYETSLTNGASSVLSEQPYGIVHAGYFAQVSDVIIPLCH